MPPENGQKAGSKAVDKASKEEKPEEAAGKQAAAEEAASGGKAAPEQEKKPAAEEEKPISEEEEVLKEEVSQGGAADGEEADIEDWADALALVAALKAEIATLQEEKEALSGELQAEKAGRLQEKEEAAVKLELVKAGAMDADYLAFKMGGEAVFDEAGNLQEAGDFVREVKKRYPALFKAAFAAGIEGVKPGDGGMGGGRRPDTGFLTYSQEQRLRERG